MIEESFAREEVDLLRKIVSTMAPMTKVPMDEDKCSSNHYVEGNTRTSAPSTSKSTEDVSGDLTEATGSVTSKAGSLESITIHPKSVSNLAQIYQSPLNHLNCSFGVVTPDEAYQSLQSTVHNQLAHNSANVVIAFLVRYPS